MSAEVEGVIKIVAGSVQEPRSRRGNVLLRVIRIFWLLVCGPWLLGACASTLLARPSLPLIVAHRGGTADAPENTLEAIRQAIDHRADAIWLTVQLSKDGVPVLYRPVDLSVLTDVSGPVASRTAAELAHVNAGWSFRSVGAGDSFPYRSQPVGIPKLRDALRAIPSNMPVILDMKALPAAPQTAAVARVLTEERAWPRVVIYSTQADYQRSFDLYPQRQLFESRDATRLRLLRVLLGEGCIDAPVESTWTGFELHRRLTVTEKFTLGEGRSEIDATLWTPESVACFRQNAKDARILVIGVNDATDYWTAACLGIDAVLTDSPRQMAIIRRNLAQQIPMHCPKQGWTAAASQ